MIRRFRALALRAAALFSGADDEFDEELASHLQLHIDDNIRSGMTPDEARRHALVKIGGVAQTREAVRERRRLPALDALAADFRYAFRLARRSPGFAAAVVFTIAVGTGANAAIFSLVHGILLTSLPVRSPGELVRVGVVMPHGEFDSFSYPMYRDLRDRNDVFSGVVARGGTQVALNEGGRSEKVRAELVTGNYFDVLGVRPAAGRLFTQDDDRSPRAHAVVVLSYAFWQRRFGGDPSAVGRTVLLNEQPMTVVGVSQAGFYGTDLGTAIDLQIPMMETPIFNPVPPTRLESRRHGWLGLIARRKAGVSLERAQASVEVLAHGIWQSEAASVQNANARKDLQDQRIVVRDGSQGLGRVQRDLRVPLLLLFGVTTVVLFVVATNLANLLLARAVSREGELAMRAALGAGPGRLLQQSLVEALMLSAAGAAVGVAVAAWGHAALIASLPAAVRANLEAHLSWPAVALLLSIAVLLAVVLGLVPAIRSARASVVSAIKREHGSVDRGALVSLRGGLVVAQVALAVPLLVGAALLGRTLVNLAGVDLGFRHDSVLLVSMNPALNGYATARTRVFFRTLLDNVRAMPGLQAAALATDSPISGGWDQLSVVIEGYTPRPGERVTPMASSVSDGYFAALGMPLVAGREFTPRDTLGAPKVAIINETMARAYFGGANPIGRHIGLETLPDTEIVGVVRDAKYVDMREPARRHFYLSVMQEPRITELTMLLRTGEPESGAVPLVRQAVDRLDAHVPVFNVKMLDRQIEESIGRERLTAWLCGGFSLLATFLAALGLYGVVAFSTVRRTREFGLRIALGAGTASIVTSAVRQTIYWVGAGLVIGLVIAFAVSRALGELLFGVSPADPGAFVLAIVTLAVSAAAATLVPARQATRVDPMTALRSE